MIFQLILFESFPRRRSRSFCVFSPETADAAQSVFPSADSSDGEDCDDDEEKVQKRGKSLKII